MNQSYSWTCNFSIGTSNLLTYSCKTGCLVWQYPLLRIRLKMVDRREAIIGPETHLLEIYAFLIAPWIVHKLEKPKKSLGSDQLYFRLIFLKKRNTQSIPETQ